MMGLFDFFTQGQPIDDGSILNLNLGVINLVMEVHIEFPPHDAITRESSRILRKARHVEPGEIEQQISVVLIIHGLHGTG